MQKYARVVNHFLNVAKNECSFAKVCHDTAEKEPPEVSSKLKNVGAGVLIAVPESFTNLRT